MWIQAELNLLTVVFLLGQAALMKHAAPDRALAWMEQPCTISLVLQVNTRVEKKRNKEIPGAALTLEGNELHTI